MAERLAPPALQRSASGMSVAADVSHRSGVELRPVNREASCVKWINGKLTIITIHDAQGKRLFYDNAAWEDIASKVSAAATPLFSQNKKAKTLTLDLTNFSITQGYSQEPGKWEKRFSQLPKAPEAKATWQEFSVSESSHRAAFAHLQTLHTAINTHEHQFHIGGDAGYSKPPERIPCTEADHFTQVDKAIPQSSMIKYMQLYCPQTVTRKAADFTFKGLDFSKDITMLLGDKNRGDFVIFYRAKTNTFSVYHPRGKKLPQAVMKHLSSYKKTFFGKKAQVKVVDPTAKATAIHHNAHLADFVRHQYQSQTDYSTDTVDIHAARASMGGLLSARFGLKVPPPPKPTDSIATEMAEKKPLMTRTIDKYAGMIKSPHFEYVSSKSKIRPQGPGKRFIGSFRSVGKGKVKHAVFFLVDMQEKKIHYYDSNGNPPDHYPENAKTLEQIKRDFPDDFTLETNAGHRQQQRSDRVNCGAYGLYMLEQVTSGASTFAEFIARNINTKAIEAERKRMAQVLSATS